MTLTANVEALSAAGRRRSQARARGVRPAARRVLGGRGARRRAGRGRRAGWRVNTWVKQGILGFRFGDIGRHVGRSRALAVLRQGHASAEAVSARGGVRIVPADRRSRRRVSRPGVICMPPMYVNIGAYVGEGTLVDSHALVGSCAQIGSRVHLSAGAQIGGVIEPGRRAARHHRRRRAGGRELRRLRGRGRQARARCWPPGVILTGSTPIYDLPNGAIIEPAEVSRSWCRKGAVVVPGARAVTVGRRPRVGAVGRRRPCIVKYRDDRTDTRTALEAWIR